MQLKITPINIEPSTSVKGITKNISDSVGFVLSTANDINRVIVELNETFKVFSELNNTDELNDRFVLISKSLAEISKSIKPAYDDSALIDRIESVESKEQPAYDDSELKQSIEQVKKSIQPVFDDKEINSSIADLLKEIEQLKESNKALESAMKSKIKEDKSSRTSIGEQVNQCWNEINRIKEANNG